MRRLLLIILVVGMLAIAGCVDTDPEPEPIDSDREDFDDLFGNDTDPEPDIEELEDDSMPGFTGLLSLAGLLGGLFLLYRHRG